MNNYISIMSVNNLYILYLLFTRQQVYFNDVDISKSKFIRYISNIRYMFDEFHIYHIFIYYDKENQCYKLLGNL